MNSDLKAVFNRKYKIAAVLMILPVIINLFVSFYCLNRLGISTFMGYLNGTLLGMFFSMIWIVIAKKVTFSNPMVLFTYSLGSFPIKLIIFAIFAFVGWKVMNMNQFFFGLSFLSCIVVSLLIEVWFMISVNRLIKQNREANKNNKK